MTPERNNDHSTAFATIFAVMCLITLLWTAWVVSEQMKQVADPVRELVVR